MNPDDYDADVLRMHLMFIGPYDEGGDWRDDHISGIVKFLGRMKRFLSSSGGGVDLELATLEESIHRHVMNFKFNKVVSTWMEFYNANKNRAISADSKDRIERMLRCFAPGFSVAGA